MANSRQVSRKFSTPLENDISAGLIGTIPLLFEIISLDRVEANSPPHFSLVEVTKQLIFASQGKAVLKVTALPICFLTRGGLTKIGVALDCVSQWLFIINKCL